MSLALRGAVAPDGDAVYPSLALGVRAVNVDDAGAGRDPHAWRQRAAPIMMHAGVHAHPRAGAEFGLLGFGSDDVAVSCRCCKLRGHGVRAVALQGDRSNTVASKLTTAAAYCNVVRSEAKQAEFGACAGMRMNARMHHDGCGTLAPSMGITPSASVIDVHGAHPQSQ